MAATNVQAFSGDVELNDRLTINSSVGNITKKSFTSYSASGLTRYWKVASGNYDGNRRNHIKMTVNIHRIDTPNSTHRLVMEADEGSLTFRPCIDEHESGTPSYPRDLRVYKNTSDTTFDIYIQVSSYSYVDVEMMYSGNSITVYDTPTWETAEPTTSGTYLLEFTNGNLNAMKIDNSGNVGIGTTNPLSPLHIRGDDCRLILADNSVDDADTNAFKCGIAFVDNTYDGTSTYAGNPEAGMGFFIGHYSSASKEINMRNLTGQLSFGTRNTIQAMYIDNDGNVGIGTANPVGVNGGQRLEGSSSTGFEYIATRDDGGVAVDDFIGAYLFKNTDTSGYEPHYAGMAAYATGTNAEMELRFFSARYNYEDDTAQMVIDRNGNVGIGTASPLSLLHVHGSNANQSSAPDTSSTTAGLMVLRNTKTGSSPYSMALGVDQTTGIGYLNAAGNSTHQPICLNTRGGNVGIGMTNPGATFEVFGESLFSVDASDDTYVKVGNRYSSSDVLVLHSVGDVIIASDSNSNMTGKNIDLRTNSSVNGGTLLMRLKDNGNVGIATDNPSTKLDVNGPMQSWTGRHVKTVPVRHNAYNDIAGNGGTIRIGNQVVGGGAGYSGSFCAFDWFGGFAIKNFSADRWATPSRIRVCFRWAFVAGYVEHVTFKIWETLYTTSNHLKATFTSSNGSLSRGYTTVWGPDMTMIRNDVPGIMIEADSNTAITPLPLYESQIYG
jgi:hypothetical protein